MKQGQAKEFGVLSAAGLGGLSDEEAQALAEKVVRELRRELAKEWRGTSLLESKTLLRRRCVGE